MERIKNGELHLLCLGCHRFIKISEYYRSMCWYCNEIKTHCQHMCIECDQRVHNDNDRRIQELKAEYYGN